jgi:hypothetical protein
MTTIENYVGETIVYFGETSEGEYATQRGSVSQPSRSQSHWTKVQYRRHGRASSFVSWLPSPKRGGSRQEIHR